MQAQQINIVGITHKDTSFFTLNNSALNKYLIDNPPTAFHKIVLSFSQI